ncbi:MAG: nuclear transport factor 2 family protein [Armatimonadota bacterium]
MLRPVPCLVALASLGALAPAAWSQNAPPAVPVTAQVPKAAEPALEADKARRDAMVAADIAKLTPLLADNLVYTHSSGKVDTKASLLEAIRTGSLDYEKIEPRDTVVRARGRTVVVTGIVTVAVKTPEGSRSFDARFTAVHGRTQDNQWQLLVWQTTRLPEPAPK